MSLMKLKSQNIDALTFQAPSGVRYVFHKNAYSKIHFEEDVNHFKEKGLFVTKNPFSKVIKDG